MKRNNKLDELLAKLIKKYPQIKSGRKNFKNYNQKVEKTLKLIEQYFKKN